jgi:hypothetical protein
LRRAFLAISEVERYLTQATPIAVSTAQPHGLPKGTTAQVFVTGVLGNKAANGLFSITVTSATSSFAWVIVRQARLYHWTEDAKRRVPSLFTGDKRDWPAADLPPVNS